MNSCFIEYNAPLVENVNVAQEVNAFSKKFFVFSQFLLRFSILEVGVVSMAVYDNVHLVCISLKVDAYISPTIVNCSFTQETSLLNRFVQCLAVVEFLRELT